MNDRGNEQWNEEYPKPEKFQKDVDSGTLFALMDGRKVLGIIVISEEQDEQYADVQWNDRGGRPLALHRIAVDPMHHKKGIADKLMTFAEGYARKNCYTSLRVDTYHKNDRSQALIAKWGFQRLPGHINFPECKGPYFCYEKIL